MDIIEQYLTIFMPIGYVIFVLCSMGTGNKFDTFQATQYSILSIFGVALVDQGLGLINHELVSEYKLLWMVALAILFIPLWREGLHDWILKLLTKNETKFQNTWSALLRGNSYDIIEVAITLKDGKSTPLQIYPSELSRSH